MHVLIWLGVHIQRSPFGLDVIKGMHIAMSLWEVPVVLLLDLLAHGGLGIFLSIQQHKKLSSLPLAISSQAYTYLNCLTKHLSSSPSFLQMILNYNHKGKEHVHHNVLSENLEKDVTHG